MQGHSHTVTWECVQWNMFYINIYIYIHTNTHMHAHILPYSMEQSPSWGDNRFAASQEFPLILWPAEVHYRIQKCLPPIPISNHHDQVLKPQHPNSWKFILILPSLLLLGLHSGLIFPAFHTKICTRLSLHHTRYMLRPSHFPRFYHPQNTGLEVHIIKLSLM